MDNFTQQHFATWFERTVPRHIPDREHIRQRMIAKFEQDPAYYNDRGWPTLYEQVIQETDTPTKVGIAVYCTVCKLRKAPRGRSVADVMANSLCNHECEGYNLEPRPGSLWPGETDADFGFPCSDDATEAL